MFHHFTDLVSNASGWAYAILFVLAFLDALVPMVPSETSVITAGVVASQGDLSLPLVILFAAAGAFAGDNTSYLSAPLRTRGSTSGSSRARRRRHGSRGRTARSRNAAAS